MGKDSLQLDSLMGILEIAIIQYQNSIRDADEDLRNFTIRCGSCAASINEQEAEKFLVLAKSRLSIATTLDIEDWQLFRAITKKQ